MSQLDNEHHQPTMGIITALPKEFAAVKSLLENQSDYVMSGPHKVKHRYLLGEIPAADSGKHLIVLSLLPDMGNNIAANRTALLLTHFPTVESIIIVGIAGGVPYPDKSNEHVRLGDIVVSNQDGVVQYDFIKEEPLEITPRHRPRPPSAALLEGVKFLEVAEIEGNQPWLRYIEQACHHLKIVRPSEEADILISSLNPEQVIHHPEDRKRIKGQPRMFVGPIASANALLKNPIRRDALRDKFGVKAVEMEGSGIADTTWYHGVGYLVVRGICDYCDSNKGDDWQEYAAIIAAAFTRALLEAMPSEIIDTVSIIEKVPITSQNGSAESSQKDKGDLPATLSNPVLLISESEDILLVEAQRIKVEDNIKMSLLPANPKEASLIAKLRSVGNNQIIVAFGTTAYFAHVNRVYQVVMNKHEVWNIELQPVKNKYGSSTGSFELAYNGYSADDIAELRARRILLNEELLPYLSSGNMDSNLNDTLLEVLIQGNNPIKVITSPLPLLYAQAKHNIPEFLVAARLYTVMWLILSGTIERIYQLDLQMEEAAKLTVKFEGQRTRQYINITPPIIRVEGVCNLVSSGNI